MTNLERNRKAKETVVDEIRERLARAKSVVLVDSRGLSVAQDTLLRKTMRKQGGIDYKVYKNSMLEFAVDGTWSEGLKEYLAGPTTVAFSFDEATLAASLISKQFKAMPHLEFKAGVIEGTVYDAEGMKIIAEIPSKEVLLSRLLGSFKSPMSSFARVVQAIVDQRQETA